MKKNKVTIVLIAYRSGKKINEFVKKIPNQIKTIIIENSNDIRLKKKIEKKYKNIKVYIKKNNGVSSSINYAVKMIKTKYFLQISPDIIFDYRDISKFLSVAEKLKDKFSALGPRFLNVKKNSHKQINSKMDIGNIDSIHGSCLFINKKKYKKIGGFDNKFFLYFEETDYCRRGRNKNLKSYQINSIKVKQKGRTVNIKDKKENKKLVNLLAWHFIWSEFNYNKKKLGYLLTIIYFIPLFIRTVFKITLNKCFKKDQKKERYEYRLKGLISAIKGQKSYLRL
ncbi:glycosyltransferase [Pelagibacterales bacterium SAG-MED20]|nr:glycosyltransferase [Pelagibacterales bacterium SAG-MED20]